MVSALIARGSPALLLRAALQTGAELCSAQPLLDELAEALARRKVASRLDRAGLQAKASLDAYRVGVIVVEPVSLPQPVCRYPDDDLVLATALAAHAQFIVSGDNDLLVLQRWNNIEIVTPRKALDLF